MLRAGGAESPAPPAKYGLRCKIRRDPLRFPSGPLALFAYNPRSSERYQLGSRATATGHRAVQPDAVLWTFSAEQTVDHGDLH
jgi:hypothetical protein